MFGFLLDKNAAVAIKSRLAFKPHESFIKRRAKLFTLFSVAISYGVLDAIVSIVGIFLF